MITLKNFIVESVFDIDDESITQKNIIKNNITYKKDALKNFNAYHITEKDIEYFITTMCEYDKSDNLPFDCYDLIWRVCAYDEEYFGIGRWQIMICSDKQDITYPVAYIMYDSNTKEFHTMHGDRTQLVRDVGAWVDTISRYLTKLSKTNNIIKKFCI